MSTNGYNWYIDNEYDDEYVATKPFIWNTSDDVDDWCDKYVDYARTVRSRGSGKSDVDYLISYLSSRYSSIYDGACGKSVKQEREKLPDSYEKGDLNELLGIGVAG